MEIDPRQPEFTSAIEGVEARAWESLPGVKASESLCDGRGLPTATALFSDAPHPLTSRVVGLGLLRPATPELLDRIIEKYEAAGADSICIPVAPTARPSTLPRLLTARGFEPAMKEAKLYRTTHDPPEQDRRARIMVAQEEDHDMVLNLYREAGMDVDWAKVAAANLGAPYWHHYVSLEDDKPVALATMFVSDGIAWCTPGWTIPEYRRRGHQRELMTHRIAAANELGCGWISANLDVTEDPIGYTIRSFTRLGFKLLYVRTTYIRTHRDMPLPNAYSRRMLAAHN